MLPSATVENYLKAILQAQMSLGKGQLVPMGQLAGALGVVPGTATTMVKTLAESGLVKYEPYAGVRLTAAGEKLATLVLRRHRLIELFLVKVMGMSWTEVHDEAEHLEHAVSDRLIDRIDEMLGRPEVDPHGDPIPDADGSLDRRHYDTLLTCPVGSRVAVSRVTDQDTSFLRFVERHDLKPGSVVEVEERDEAADSVRLRSDSAREITIGARAASKVLVKTVQMLLLWLMLPALAAAQTTAPAPSRTVQPFAILDNSFLVEEAFNQERGIFQNIFGFQRADGAWEFAFTQEWPVGSQTHQFSYTLPFAGVTGARGFGDVMINYRYQAVMEDPGIPAFSPRVSLILPTGGEGFSYESVGLQVNLPFSKQRGDVYFHWNAGFTWHPRAEARIGSTPDPPAPSVVLPERGRVSLFTPHLSASGIYRVKQMFNLMIESVLEFEELPMDAGTSRQTVFTLSPGARGGWNLGDHQLILGAAVPITWVESGSSAGILLYLSYELPFGR
ncbi:MAG TPA: metal-dependent transcriptional regulator [Vicinamibacterales bacterium]|nr:metal-dependent transcriptional regulator [Vicinamibacterales bacterium]